MNKPTHIRRNLMLKMMDIRWLEFDKRNIISIKFVDNSGKLRYIPQAYVCGLPWNVAKNRQRGIQPCDCKGNKEGHVYPVGIDYIIEFNHMTVIL